MLFEFCPCECCVLCLVYVVASVNFSLTVFLQYMIILFLLFLIQFSLACACLAMNDDQKDALATRGWKYASNKTRYDVQSIFNCCGLTRPDLPVTHTMGHPPCAGVSIYIYIISILFFFNIIH